MPFKGPYPSFMIHDFPKFLTDEISIIELEKLKQKQKIMHEHNHITTKIAEENRLKYEAKTFIDKIHQIRLSGKTIDY